MKPGKMGKLLKQAQQAQVKMQEELGELRVEGSSGGGAVIAAVDGHKNIVSVTIAPEALEDGDASMLSDMVLAALADAQKNAEAEAEKRMSSLVGGLGLPPGLGF